VVSDFPAPPPEEDVPPLSPSLVRKFAVGFYFLLGAAGLIWVRSRTGAWWPETLTGGDAGSSLLYGVALAALVIGATGPMVRFLPWMRWLSREMRRVLGPVDLRTAVVVALASGIGEELFFRGALLPVVGLTTSSVLFAVVHTGPDRRYLAWTAFSLGIGFALGAIVLETGSLVGPLVAHVAINAVNLRRIGRMDPGGVDSPQSRASVPE
jgi:membrane protease YdiL (CAAX protease family)